jgi:hypothetical protein
MAKAKTEEAEAPSKSESIRMAMKDNPKSPPAEIVEILKAKGVEVAVGLVYQVKANLAAKKKPKEPKASTKAPAASNATVSIAALGEVKKLAESVGGLDNLEKIVQALK